MLVEQVYNLVTHVKTYPRLGLAILTVPGCKALRYIPVHGIVGGRMRCMICNFVLTQTCSCQLTFSASMILGKYGSRLFWHAFATVA